MSLYLTIDNPADNIEDVRLSRVKVRAGYVVDSAYIKYFPAMI